MLGKHIRSLLVTWGEKRQGRKNGKRDLEIPPQKIRLERAEILGEELKAN